MTKTTARKGSAVQNQQKGPEITIVPPRDQIASLAYAIWERRGRPQGQAISHWAEAEVELSQKAMSGHRHNPGTS